ncbi:MAG: tRNA dimethylallyltransferase [Alphaproteobacteria bacterium]|jgi:tRNA dimethylallyltransferase
MSRHVITIFGPTASGKTALSIFLANKLNGVIINADSRQVYKNMPIITAMPSQAEFEAADHRLFNFLEVDEKISSDVYTNLAKAEIEKIWAEGKLPILCGGTGFYLKNLEQGISPVPALAPALFDLLNKRVENEGAEALHAELALVDPIMAQKLAPGDSQRVSRALGVFMQTGQPMSTLQALPKEGGLDAKFIKIALNPNREWLYARIHKRYDVMESMGLLAEIKNLKNAGYNNDAHGIQSCGVKDLFNFVDGNCTHEEAKNALLQSTRNYAKRQLTWIKGQYNADMVFTNTAEGENAIAEIQCLLK